MSGSPRSVSAVYTLDRTCVDRADSAGPGTTPDRYHTSDQPRGYVYCCSRRGCEFVHKMSVRLHIRSARAAGSSSVSIAVDKETTLTELKSLVADQDLVKTNLSVMIDLAEAF